MIERGGEGAVLILGLELDSRGMENDGRVSHVHREKGICHFACFGLS